jgi:hypothetical protein
MASCVIRYNDTFITYMIDILAQQKTVASRDVKFDEDMKSSKSQDSPLKIEKNGGCFSKH